MRKAGFSPCRRKNTGCFRRHCGRSFRLAHGDLQGTTAAPEGDARSGADEVERVEMRVGCVSMENLEMVGRLHGQGEVSRRDLSWTGKFQVELKDKQLLRNAGKKESVILFAPLGEQR